MGEIGEGMEGTAKSGHSKNILSTSMNLLKKLKNMQKLQRHLNRGKVHCKAFFSENYKYASL